LGSTERGDDVEASAPLLDFQLYLPVGLGISKTSVARCVVPFSHVAYE